MKRILIANRGEIAVRIARACADTGRTSIAVYADQDADALHVRVADEAVALEGSTGAETYLDIEKLVRAAVESGADAVHPGYGFRSESAEFARAVQEAGLVWIGPSPEAIERLGDKVSARRIAESVGAPLVAGTPGPVESAEAVVAFAAEHGLPVAIKAAHGGGGRGMRVAWREDELVEQYEAAVREAVQAFGRGECFVERFLDRPRHVEVQVLADQHGTVLALGTRDCSLQRRNQKLVEEAPAPFLTPEQESRLLESAAGICRAAGYAGAGTVEFLLGAEGDLSFLEVNTRLQVEHPVTEETSDLDLVAWQLRVAAGEALDPALAERRVRGHALEFRINAEDPGRGFLPGPGTITRFRAPAGPGVRVDAGVESGSEVPGAFDSLFAKLIVWGPDRRTALARSRRALAEFEVDGIPTVLPFHRAVVEHPAFAAEDALGVHTRWIETEFAEEHEFQPAPTPAEAAGVTRTWIELDGRRVRLGLPAGLALGAVAGGAGAAPGPAGGSAGGAAGAGEGDVVATIAGSVVHWLVEDGETVEAGQSVVVMEAMKMEARVDAPRAGTLRHGVEPGAQLAAGEVLGRVEA
ncbi:acetyl/propionyl/methylcrotonyl-CoA carboxylase subunit alpha [Homoserinibacter sp. YIM 151385]|uniref:acetyl/propionyl/methylcrotonyl-CoA carboxylase subunit alpha n=1 Tax=Homoserinibacter sp. YIM 151385 TaxID=2985506 RepID=UPI0022F06369|nr:biotin carboxylase N-terminal domain-containing protein [Homoserinibacter sp. YIM 151385]WBU37884.1 ATP-grasp domain-containing protein [Homoserinibacter sp. YIM 151385]